MGLNRIDKIKGSKQDNQNLGARNPKGLNRIAKIWEQENQSGYWSKKPKGLNRIDKAKGHKQDSHNLGVRKPKGLNTIAKIWEQENQRT